MTSTRTSLYNYNMDIKRTAFKTVPKTVLWITGIVILLVLILFAGTYFADRPLTRYMQSEINKNLKGYTVTLENAHFQPIGLDLTLKGVTIRQDANPEPPVASFPVFEASLHWKSLIHARIVGELTIHEPKLHIDLRQLSHESAQKFPVKQEGWQQALKAIYPLDINHINITGGDVLYIDQDPNRPLHITSLNTVITNIRNIKSPEKEYPSPIHLEGVIFDKGSLTLDGDADFLAEPYAGLKVEYKLKDVPLDNFKPELARKNLQIKGGMIASDGELEYSPKVKTAHVRELDISGVHLDYVHAPETATVESQRVEKVKEVAAEAQNKPGLLTRIDYLKIDGSEFGYVNETMSPPYRVYFSDVSLKLSNLSNHFTEGTSYITLNGRFMGSGPSTVTAAFRPDVNGPDFDLKVQIDKTKLVSMSDLIRAYGNFDVSDGLFSLYVDVHIKNKEINGTVKPIFTNMQVVDNRPPEEKNLFHSLYVKLVGGVSWLLRNPGHKTVATQATITGTVDQPRTSNWEIVGYIISNAWFHAILPGFEEQANKKKAGG